jgi:low temperature requirement protein LtrA
MLVCEALGVSLGLIGSIFVSLKSSRARRVGFLIWIASNSLLIVLGLKLGTYGLVGMYSVYCVTSIIGWKNNRKEINVKSPSVVYKPD